MSNSNRDSKGRFTKKSPVKTNGHTRNSGNVRNENNVRNGNNGNAISDSLRRVNDVRYESPVVNTDGLDLESRVMNSYIMNGLELLRRTYGSLYDSRKDIDKECGYPSTAELTIKHFKDMYDRECVAKRIVGIYPDESWVVSPVVFERENSETRSQFELDIEALAHEITGSKWFQSDGISHPLWEYCYNADIMAGIGHFGVLLIGTNHPGKLDTPLEFKPGKKTFEITYLRVFDETMVEIESRVKDETSPRYTDPEYYNITFDSGDIGGTTKKKVHWSRVIHIPTGISESSEVLTVPRLLVHYNRVVDIRKLLGGSGEMYWRGALPPVFLESHESLGPKVQVRDESRNEIEKMIHSLKRWAFIPGVKANQLSPTVVDPSKQIDVQLENICVELSCPKRVFLGSERGELASSQDVGSWNKRIVRRQNRYLLPRIVVKVIDRLINIGVLTMPERYFTQFPSLESISASEQAKIARDRTDSIVKAIQGDIEQAMTMQDFWTYIIGLSDSEARGIVERAIASEPTIELSTDKDEEDPNNPNTPPADEGDDDKPPAKKTPAPAKKGADKE